MQKKYKTFRIISFMEIHFNFKTEEIQLNLFIVYYVQVTKHLKISVKVSFFPFFIAIHGSRNDCKMEKSLKVSNIKILISMALCMLDKKY